MGMGAPPNVCNFSVVWIVNRYCNVEHCYHAVCSFSIRHGSWANIHGREHAYGAVWRRLLGVQTKSFCLGLSMGLLRVLLRSPRLDGLRSACCLRVIVPV